jgi:hypothetical protein
MASTYTTNSGIELIASGEQSGTWGTTTNTNLSIIDRLVNGVGAIALAGTTHTLTTSDGVLSDGQYSVLVFGGAPSGTNTVTISPNDGQHVYIVWNVTSESVVLTQGSGGNVTVASGDTKVVYADGTGAGAAVIDITANFAMSSVKITGGSITGITDLAIVDGGTGASSASAARTNLGLAIGTDVQAYDAELTAIAGLAVTDGNILVGNGTTWVAESGATARTSLGLSIGTNVQAYDAGLQSISGLTTSADQMIYTTALDTYATTGLTAAGRALLDDADASAQRTTLGLAIGTNVQAYDAELTAIAALAVTDGNIIVGDGTTWVAESGATARTSLGLGTMATQAASSVTITGGSITGITDLAVADGGTGASDAGTARTNLGLAIGTDVQAYDAGLQSISGLTTSANQMIYTTALDTYATTGLTAAGRAILDDADASAQRTTLGLAIGTDVQAYDAELTAIAGLAVTDGNIIVGNGTTWVAESGATARTSLGLGAGDSPTFTAVTAGQVDVTAQGDVRFQDAAGGQFVALQGPGTVATSYTLSLPTADGTNGQAVVTSGSGQLSFSDVVTPTGTQTLTNKTLTDPAIIGAILEDIFTITDGAAFEIDPGNGTIQLITLGASRTPKATNFANGESVTLMVNDGSAYTLTWTDATFGGSGVVWKTDGGTAPTLNTTGYTIMVLFKVGGQVYGARVGNA